MKCLIWGRGVLHYFRSPHPSINTGYLTVSTTYKTFRWEPCVFVPLEYVHWPFRQISNCLQKITTLHKSGARTSIFNTPTVYNITNTYGVHISCEFSAPEPLERIIPLPIGSFLQSVRVTGNLGEQVHNIFSALGSGSIFFIIFSNGDFKKSYRA